MSPNKLLRRTQRGATLVVALLVMVLIMMIGITAVTVSKTQFTLAGNLQFEDAAMNNAEAALAAGEAWLNASTDNYNNAGFTSAGYLNNATRVNYLYPSNVTVDPLTMTWSDSNSFAIAGTDGKQRYYIQQLTINNSLGGTDLSIRQGSFLSQKVNTYVITARGESARGAVKFVQSNYSVLQK
jgi:type IV pilus assembly protein PilX